MGDLPLLIPSNQLIPQGMRVEMDKDGGTGMFFHDDTDAENPRKKWPSQFHEDYEMPPPMLPSDTAPSFAKHYPIVYRYGGKIGSGDGAAIIPPTGVMGRRLAECLARAGATGCTEVLRKRFLDQQHA